MGKSRVSPETVVRLKGYTPGELAAYLQGRIEAARDGNQPWVVDDLRELLEWVTLSVPT